MKTSGGPPPSDLSVLEDKIVTIIGETAIEGVEGGVDTPENTNNKDATTSWINQPIDCKEAHENGHKTNGVYRIYPKGIGHGYDVYCDMLNDGGGWTVFQRRIHGSVNFYRTWKEYMNGFGDVRQDYWLGNERVHKITTEGVHTLRIDMMDQTGIWKYATYDNFYLSDENAGYKLSAGTYHGDAGDALRYHIGMTFKTKDNDSSVKGCATMFQGAWWYDSCHNTNLNGLYGNTEYGKGMTWHQWHGQHYSVKITEMKMRRI